MKATNVIDVLTAAYPGRRYFCNPDYPFIPQVKADPKYWARKGWKLSPTGRAVVRIKK